MKFGFLIIAASTLFSIWVLLLCTEVIYGSVYQRQLSEL